MEVGVGDRGRGVLKRRGEKWRWGYAISKKVDFPASPDVGGMKESEKLALGPFDLSLKY